MENSPPNAKPPFGRIRKSLKEYGIKTLLATVSGVAVCYAAQYFIGLLVFSQWASWGLVLGPLALFNMIHNNMVQARGLEMKNALLLDWYEMASIYHFLAIAASVVVLCIPQIYNWFSGSSSSGGQTFPETKSLAQK